MHSLLYPALIIKFKTIQLYLEYLNLGNFFVKFLFIFFCPKIKK